MLDYCKGHIHLRKSNPGLKQLNRKNLEVKCNADQKTLLLKRWNENDKIICFINFSKQKRTIPIPQLLCKKIFDSANQKWNGPGSSPKEIKEKIIVEPELISVYQTHY